MTARPTEHELLALKGTTVPVQRILDLFGVRVRNHRTVHEISQALADAGLTTLPDFGVCGSREEVDVVALVSAAAKPEGGGTDGDAEEEALPSHALPQRILLGDLPSARRGVRCVGPGHTLAQTTYLMRTRGLAQVPVTTGMAAIHGVVTWRSVAKMYELGKDQTLDNAMEKDSVPVADARQELFISLPTVKEHGYVLVRGDDGCLSGIVTTADVTDRFEGAARPFFIVGEIESLLRRCLGAALDREAIRAAQRIGNSGLITDLAFGDYLTLLNGEQGNAAQAQRADANWAALNWPAMDRNQFIGHLRRVKAIRNRIAHFDEKPLPEQQMRELTSFAKLLRDFVS
ncbi:CBS domain-containing protein [Actinacidiphila glaucinigra]|uniref:CBS domain-containing protein n=1 Tax=Actinacidiphila glaucinigra TaxID=235986 RepID=UPI00371BEE8B